MNRNLSDFIIPIHATSLILAYAHNLYPTALFYYATDEAVLSSVPLLNADELKKNQDMRLMMPNRKAIVHVHCLSVDSSLITILLRLVARESR